MRLHALAALTLALLAPAMAEVAPGPPLPVAPESFAFLDRADWPGERLSDFCNGAAPLFEAYGVERLDLYRYEGARSASVSVERYALRTADAAYGLFSHLAATLPVELEGLSVAWTGGVGLLLSGQTCWRTVGLDRVPFMLWARAMRAAGEPPAGLPAEAAAERGAPGARFVRLLPTATHLENHRPDLAGIPALAGGAARFLLVEREEEGRPSFTLVAEAKGQAFDRAALARDLAESGFADVRRLGSRLTATGRRGKLEFRFEGKHLRVRPLPEKE